MASPYAETALGQEAGGRPTAAAPAGEEQQRQPGIESTKPRPAAAEPGADENVKAIQRLNKIIRATKTCMLTTRSREGLHARPMSTAGIDFDTGKGGNEEIYFVTSKRSAKVEEIRRDPATCLAFSNDAAGTWATLSANAEVVDDPAKLRELWSPIYNAYFPEGPTGEDTVLIKATPTTGSYWQGYGFGITKAHILLSALKAKFTKHPIKQSLTQDAQTVRFPMAK